MKRSPIARKPRKCKAEGCDREVFGTNKFCTKKCETAYGVAKRKAKKKPETWYRREADKLWASLIRDLAGGRCEICGQQGTEAHHMITKATCKFLRHVIANGVYVCAACHLRFHNKEALTAWTWMKKARPDDYAYIREHMNDICKASYSVAYERMKGLREVQDEKMAEAA